MADILIERFEVTVTSNGQTLTLANDVGSLDKAFVRLITSSIKGTGQVGDTGNMGPNDIGVSAQLTGTDEVTFNCQLTANYKVMAEVWRYVGAPGGAYEFIVRQRGTVTLAATGQSSNTTTISGLTDRNKAIPVYNGFVTPETSNSDFEAHSVALHINASDELVVSRNNTGGGGDHTAYYAVVEFTGSAWSVGHGVSTSHDSAGLTGTSVTLNTDSTGSGGSTFDVGDWSTATILEGSLEGDSSETGLADAMVMFEPNTTSSVTLSLGDNNARNDGTAYVHVLQCDDLVVNRYTSSNYAEGNNGYGADITVSGANSATPLSQLAVEWFSSTTGTGRAWARGVLLAQLTAYNTIRPWVQRSGNNVSVKAGVIDLSALTDVSSGPEEGQLAIYNGSTYSYHFPKVWNGSAWIQGITKYWDGSQWVATYAVPGGGSVTNQLFTATDASPAGSNWNDVGGGVMDYTTNSSTAPVNTETTRKLVYTTPTLEAGDYVVWVKGINSVGLIWVGMNDSDDTYRADSASSLDWVSDYQSGPGNDLTNGEGKMQWTLTAGVHTIEIYGGFSSSCEVHEIYITKDGDTPS